MKYEVADIMRYNFPNLLVWATISNSKLLPEKRENVLSYALKVKQSKL